MIDIDRLTDDDIGRKVIYHPRGEVYKRECGYLSSWSDRFVFVRFDGPGGEACRPCDVEFAFGGQ